MNNLLAKLLEIGEKAEYLNQRTELLVAENRSLKARMAELEQQLADRSQALDSLEEQHKIVKLAKSMGGESEHAEELKRKINEYIREIDQCLKLIGD